MKNAIITVERLIKREDGKFLIDFIYENKKENMNYNGRELYQTDNRKVIENNLKNLYYKTKEIIWEC